MTTAWLLSCIGMVSILCVNVGYITGMFGKVKSMKAAQSAAGLIFVIMVIDTGLILLFG